MGILTRIINIHSKSFHQCLGLLILGNFNIVFEASNKSPPPAKDHKQLYSTACNKSITEALAKSIFVKNCPNLSFFLTFLITYFRFFKKLFSIFFDFIVSKPSTITEA